jgi:hypothetical protein
LYVLNGYPANLSTPFLTNKGSRPVDTIAVYMGVGEEEILTRTVVWLDETTIQ